MDKTGIKQAVVCFGLLVTATVAFADTETSALDNLYVGASSGVALGKSDESNNSFYHFVLGYDVNNYLDVQFGGSYIGDMYSSSNSMGSEAIVRGKLPLNDAARLYLDGGYRMEGNHFSAGTGLLFQISPRWDIDVGYRYYQQPNSEEQGDTYMFAAGIQYYFNERQQSSTVKYIESLSRRKR